MKGQPQISIQPRPSGLTSWWLQPDFQRGERTPEQERAEQRMKLARVSTPGETRVIWSNRGRV